MADHDDDDYMKMYQTDDAHSDVEATPDALAPTVAVPAVEPAATPVASVQTQTVDAITGDDGTDDNVSESDENETAGKSGTTKVLGLFVIAAVVLLGFQTVRTSTSSTNSSTIEQAVEEIARETETENGNPPTMDAVLESAAQWRTANGSFYAFTPPDGYLMAVGYGNIVFSVRDNGVCVIGAIVNGNDPAVATDPTGAGCELPAMAEAQTAIDTAESG